MLWVRKINSEILLHDVVTSERSARWGPPYRRNGIEPETRTKRSLPPSKAAQSVAADTLPDQHRRIVQGARCVGGRTMKRHLEEHPRGVRVLAPTVIKGRTCWIRSLRGWVAAGRLSISPRRPECQTSPRLSRFSKITTLAQHRQFAGQALD
jgi:hypothetical protein